jgi:NADH-quinone oxidoreductase subunit L
VAILAVLAAVAGGLKASVPGAGQGFGELVRFGEAQEAVSYPAMILSVGAALLGLAVAWAAYGKGLLSPAAFNARFPQVYRLLKNAWYLNLAWELFATRVVIAGSALFAWFDRRIVNGMVDGVAWLCGAGSRQLRRLQTGQAQLYAFAIVLGLIAGLVAILGGAAHGVTFAGGGR